MGLIGLCFNKVIIFPICFFLALAHNRALARRIISSKMVYQLN